MPEFRLPNNTQRVAIIGRTGSGKTQFAAWMLSRAPFEHQPYIIVDYKGDDLLNSIDRARVIGLNEKIPSHPGLYIIQPLPSQKDEVEAWMWKVWQHEHVGLYFDEMYNVPDPQKGGALRAIFTQGRSKRIPVIGLTQRPRQISRFLFSEADYFAVFHLSTRPDIEAVHDFAPFPDIYQPLPKYSCRWYDVSEHARFVLSPVSDGDEILDYIDKRLTPKRRSL